MGKKTTIFGISVLLIFLIGFYSNALGATLSWDANTDEVTTGYCLCYSTTEESLTPKVDLNNATKEDIGNVISYSTDSLTLADDTTYYFVVTAYNSEKVESGPSNMVLWKTPLPPDTTPPGPTEELEGKNVTE